MAVTAFTLTQGAFMDGRGLFETQWGLILVLSVTLPFQVADFVLSKDHTALRSQNCCVHGIWVNEN